MKLTFLMLLLPLVGFVVLGLAGRAMPRSVIALLGCGVVLASFVIALTNFFQMQSNDVYDKTYWTWLNAGGLNITFGVLVDHLSSIMMLVVTGVGFLIHVYSAGYMEEEDNAGYARFFSFMNLFIFMMSLLVLADSFLFLLVGWAGVGLASFLLIGFWYTRPTAVQAARKAFVVNVIGDFGLMIAIFLLVGKVGTLNYANVLLSTSPFATRPILFYPNGDAMTTAIALMLIVAAAAKSAQLPLHVWLPDAMEGPTPVSALIHAATMVTAGVYLIARTHVIFEAAPVALAVVGIIGGASALYAATVALFQYDIKRVLAYSTMSQLGYMFMAESVGANTSAIFHLTTHAFFKALLFMAAGGVIHALGGEQDIRKMGGLRDKLPITFWSFVIGGLALSGIPPFAGFWSKDAILGAILARSNEAGASPWYLVLYGVGLLVAVLTGLYTFRLIFIVFFGQSRVAANAGHGRHVHEVGMTMAAPMVALLALSVVGGLDGIPGMDRLGAFLRPDIGVPVEGGNTLGLSLTLGVVAALVGVGLAWQRYGARVFTFVENRNPFYRLLLNAWYINDIYSALIVRPILSLSRGLNLVLETWALDGGSRGVAQLVRGTSNGLRRMQSGFARNYALGIMLGAVLIVLYYVVGPNGR